MEKMLNTKNLIIGSLVLILVLSVFFIGRSSKTPETIYIESSNDDSLRIELNMVIESNRIKDSILDMWSYEIDSLILEDKIATIRTKRTQKKSYENTKKMSLDSAIVAGNILLDSAINAQRRITETASDSTY